MPTLFAGVNGYAGSDAISSFLAPQRIARKPWCADLDKVAVVRPLATALTKPYINLDLPTAVTGLTIDVDRDAREMADPGFWRNEGLPPPNWLAVGDNGRPHVRYDVEFVVLKAGDGIRPKPLAYADAVEDALIAALRADPNKGRLLTKNPASGAWKAVRLRQQRWTLDELAGWLDLPPRGWRRHADAPASGLGRNCDLFDDLRHYAYSEVGRWRRLGESGCWHSHLAERANIRNAELFASSPSGLLPPVEVRSIAKSVARWTWERYTGHGKGIKRGAMAAHLSPSMDLQQRQVAAAHFAARQQVQASQSRIAEARAALEEQGQKASQAAVAAVTGLGIATVKRHWRASSTGVSTGIKRCTSGSALGSGHPTPANRPRKGVRNPTGIQIPNMDRSPKPLAQTPDAWVEIPGAPFRIPAFLMS